MERSSHPPKCSCARFLLFLVNCLRVVLRLLSPLTCLAAPFVDPFQMTVEAASLGIAKDLISVPHTLGGNVTFCDSVSSCPVPMHSKFNLTCCSSSSISGSTTFRLRSVFLIGVQCPCDSLSRLQRRPPQSFVYPSWS